MTEKRMKVWQVDDLREFMLDGGVQMPASFTGRKHYRNMLAWHLRGETYNIESRIKDQTQYFGKDLIHELGMDRFLHRAGTNLLKEVAGRNLYFIGDEPNVLIRSWFSATPLLHLKDARASFR